MSLFGEEGNEGVHYSTCDSLHMDFSSIEETLLLAVLSLIKTTE